MKPFAIALLSVLLAGCAAPLPSPTRTASPTPTRTATPASDTASPSAVADEHYRLSLLDAQGSTGPTRLIATPANCDSLPTDWSRSVCALTLRSDWPAIIAPTDPFAPPPNGYSSPTSISATARAQIEGDTTLCSDVTMREWFTAGSSVGGPPPAGSTPAPLRPIASCLADLRTTATTGSFSVENSAGDNMLKFLVDPGAVARAAGGSAPMFDPKVVCTTFPGSGRESLTRDVCNQLVDAVTTALGSRQSGVTALLAYPGPIECLKLAPACPSTIATGWLGSVVAALAGSQGLGFDVTKVGGQVTVTEVPYQP